MAGTETTTETTETTETKPDTIARADHDKAINAAVERALRAERKKTPAVTAEDLVELESLRKEREDRELKEAERKGEYDKALEKQRDSLKAEYEPKLTEAQEQNATLLERLRQTTVRQELLRASAAHNAYDAEQVTDLLDRHVSITDEFEVRVVEKDGKTPRFVGGTEMSIDQLVEEFLGKNPNLVKAGTAGSPAGGAPGGATTKGAGAGTPLAEAQAELDALKLQYEKTRDSNILLKLPAAKRKVAAAETKTA